MDKVLISGIFYSLLAGIIAATQNVFSARIGSKLGMWEASFVVHSVGLIFAFAMVSFFGNGNLKNISEVNKVYLLGGVLGVFIIFTIANGVSSLGASLSTALMVIAQLFFAALIDTFGLFGTERITFDFTKIVGLVIMVIGVIVFNYKG